MKIQNSFFTLLILLFAFAGSSLQAQSTRDKATAALAKMPSEATIKKLDASMQKIVREDIAILKEIQKTKDGNSAEARALDARSERNSNALKATAKAECKKKCIEDYDVCLVECGSVTLCRAACRSSRNWCIIKCHYSTVRPELDLNENVQNETGGGKQ